MSHYLDKQKEKLRGPWHLDEDALRELGSILEEQWKTLETENRRAMTRAKKRAIAEIEQTTRYATGSEEQKSEMQNAVADSIKQRSQFKKSRKINLEFKNGKGLTLETVDEMLNSTKVKNEVIKSMTLEMENNGTSVSIVIGKFLSDAMEISVIPSQEERSEKFKLRLTRWADKYKPSFSTRILSTWVISRWVFSWLLLLFLYQIAYVAAYKENPAIIEARQLIERGIEPEEQARALELLLAIQSGVSKRADQFVAPPWLSWVSIAILLLTTFFSYPIASTFGVGKGRSALTRQRKYIRFVTYGVPVVIAGGIVFRVVQSISVDYLKSIIPGF